MSTFHKIILNGRTFYREYHGPSGLYEDEMLSEEDLVERLLEEAVESTIEVDQSEITRIINCIPNSFQREKIQTYIEYLETLVESLE